MLNNSDRQKNYRVTQHFYIFSVDFTQRWLRISETINDGKNFKSQKLVFKDSIIFGLHRTNLDLRGAL